MADTKQKTLPESLTALVQGQIRISWRICGATGSGHWWHFDDRSLLADTIAPLNLRYGAGSHWIEVCGDSTKETSE
jgi:hypothetical protein